MWSCGSSPAAQGPNQDRIATGPPGVEVHNLATAYGVLSGKGNADGTACFWFDNAGIREALVWPSGYKAGGTPLGVYNSTGSLMAAVGNSVRFGGASSTPQDLGSSVVGCTGYSRVFVVGEVNSNS